MKNAILFDLDGTLLDTLGDICKCLNVVLDQHGYPGHSREEVKRMLGFGARTLVVSAIPEDVRGHNEAVDLFLQRYVAYYNTHATDITAPFAGIHEMLKAFFEKGVPMGVCSNKPHDATVSLVSHYFKDFRFQSVSGERAGILRKPDPALPLQLAHEMGVLPENILFVGDSLVDIQTAKAAGMISVGVSWGYVSGEELQAAGADFFAKSPEDIVKYFFSK